MENVVAMDYFTVAIVLYLIGATTLAWPKATELAAHYAGTFCAAVASGLVAYSALAYMTCPACDAGTIVNVKWGAYSLLTDYWSAAFLLFTGTAGMIVSIYAVDYAKGYLGNRLRALTGLWNIFILSMVIVLVAGDAFTFIVAWEVMALASFLLVNHESSKKETVAAAYQYMIMTHIGTAAIMIAFYLIGSHADSMSFSDMMHNTLDDNMRSIAFLCAFAGFALKSGIMPMHIWLPNAHPAAPSHVSALMSGVMLKVAIYGLGRVVFNLLGIDFMWQGILVMVAGLISAFLGVLYASMENDMKRSLAYSSVENMGIIFAAFGCGMVLYSNGNGILSTIGFAAALMHCFAHSFMKCLLFMSAGSVMHATGSKNMELMGGLIRKMPYTAAFTLVGAMSLCALPFTSGLISEWMVLQGYITLAQYAGTPEMRLLVIFAFIMLGLTGATALGCFVRMYSVVFLGRARNEIAEKAHEQHFFMLLGMGMDAVLILLIGIMPDMLVNTVQEVFGGAMMMPMALPLGLLWSGSGDYSLYCPLILLAIFAIIVIFTGLLCYKNFEVKDVTWNCGTYPTARQQYSATGISKPLRRAFDYILQPVKETVKIHKKRAYHGQRFNVRLSIPDLFHEKIYQPLQDLIVTTSIKFRAIQDGSVRLYIGYTMTAMIIVLIWGVLLS